MVWRGTLLKLKEENIINKMPKRNERYSPYGSTLKKLPKEDQDEGRNNRVLENQRKKDAEEAARLEAEQLSQESTSTDYISPLKQAANSLMSFLGGASQTSQVMDGVKLEFPDEVMSEDITHVEDVFNNEQGMYISVISI